MTKFLLIGGLIFFFGSFALAPTAYEKYRVERFGHLVNMRIEHLPKSCIGARVRYFIHFSYNGESYDKATRGDFCDKHHVGQLVQMKMLDGSKYILFPKESALFGLASLLVICMFGLILSIAQYRKLRSI